MNLLAGQTQDLRFDADTREFKPSIGNPVANPDGSPGDTFTIKTLNYWEWQTILNEPDAISQTRKGCELGLVSIDGDAEAAKTFLANPAMRLINPLFQAIVDAAAGN